MWNLLLGAMVLINLAALAKLAWVMYCRVQVKRNVRMGVLDEQRRKGRDPERVMLFIIGQLRSETAGRRLGMLDPELRLARRLLRDARRMNRQAGPVS